jgi:SOS-response transcriptional repressor LexA
MVVALLKGGPSEHGEATLKHYYAERNRIRLQPANSTMRPIYARPEDVEIQGKVITVIRRMRHMKGGEGSYPITPAPSTARQT